jgi:hypothetical protein
MKIRKNYFALNTKNNMKTFSRSYSIFAIFRKKVRKNVNIGVGINISVGVWKVI